MEYQQSCHQVELVAKDEEARRLKVSGLLLRDENSSLKDQILHKDDALKSLCNQSDNVRTQLESAKQECSKHEKLMQSQSREIANLKVCSLVTSSTAQTQRLTDQCCTGRTCCPQHRD
jgi:hypothetical protein